ncbi:flagellar hook-length control protein FliK [Pedomonas mirosovicensis]|uniref:flagellar hook-length control protein FliK n=1 Tax=Pedomonas mirosovicensis TaxID=2908641 RepID=UPI0021686331|nr:flagellar hook-length control protein FliK [Pedomonas mirosovicensis]MCH8685882.1 flagellar hook-length control protein FliK [Pedomonas mirosovicensis]
MTGFLPILTASHGATPQTAPDAVAAPAMGAEDAFAAVLAGLSGTEGGAAPADTRVPGETQTALTGKTKRGFVVSTDQVAGSALQRLKLAFSDAGTASSILSLMPASAQAVPGAAAEAALPDGIVPAGNASAEMLAGIAPGGAPDIKHAAEHADAKPDATPADQQVAPELQPQTPATTDTPAAADASPQAGITAPVPAETPPLTGKADTDTDSAPETVETADADQAAMPVNPAYPAVAVVQQVVQQPTEPAPHTLVSNAPAMPAGIADNGAIPAAAAMAQAGAPMHGAPAAAPAKTETQPELKGGKKDQAQPEHTLTSNAAQTAAPAPASDTAALAAIAPAARRTAQTPPPAATAPVTGEAPAETADGAKAAHADAAAIDAPAQGKANGEKPAKVGAFDSLMAQLPQQPGAAPTAEARVATGKPVVAETGLADKPIAEIVAGAKKHPAAERARADEPRADNADTAKPKADVAQGAQTVRPAAVTAEAPAQPAAPQATTPDGLQPVSAHPAATHGTAPHATAQPHAADVVKVATPHHLPEAVSMAISRHVGNNATEFALRLDPAELGRIEVKLELGKDGQAVVHIQADNASTMDLLRRDAHVLERALADTGLRLDSGGLNFSLRQQDGQAQQQFAGESGSRSSLGQAQETALAGPEADTLQRPSRRSATGLLDLSI